MQNSENPFSLKGKTILVTGASSGIGRAIAIECAKMGANMIITGRNEERLNSTLKSLKGKHSAFIADLTVEEDIANLVNQIDKIDGIVNSAGIADPLPFQFIDKEKIDLMLDANFSAPILLTHKILRSKKFVKGSSIVFISSISGVHISMVGGSLYSASKGAINGMIKGMALDLAPNYRINSVCPGIIGTPILDSGIFFEGQLEEYKRKHPLKRNGTPEEVAYAAIYLLSDASRWVTGTNIVVDGGYTLL